MIAEQTGDADVIRILGGNATKSTPSEPATAPNNEKQIETMGKVEETKKVKD